MSSYMPKTGPKDFFIYLGITITLYASVVALINLLFSVIDATFPDVLFSFSYTGGTRAAIATLIIIFPLYLLLTHLSYRELSKDPAKKDLREILGFFCHQHMFFWDAERLVSRLRRGAS